MASLLKPAYSVTLGSQQWTEQLLGLELKLEATPLIDVLTVRLPFQAPLKADVGDDVKVTLDSGDQKADVFTGKVDSIRRTYDSIRLTALNAGAQLASYRPATTHEQVTIGTLVGALCDDAGVDTGDLEDGANLAFYSANPERTALEHIARVCGWAGAMARVTADNHLESLVINGATPDLALRYGRELFSMDQDKLASSIDDFTMAGESGAGSASDPNALRPTTDFFAGNRPDGPSDGHVWAFEPALRTAQAAGTAGAARLRAYQAGRQRGTLEAFLQPTLRPGTVFEVQDLPDPLQKGPYWIGGVVHRLTPASATTRARFYIGGSKFDPLALLVSLASLL